MVALLVADPMRQFCSAWYRYLPTCSAVSSSENLSKAIFTICIILTLFSYIASFAKTSLFAESTFTREVSVSCLHFSEALICLTTILAQRDATRPQSCYATTSR